LREVLIKFCTIQREGVRSKADRIVAQERAIRLHSYGDLVELLCEPLGRNQLKATFEELETLYFKPMDVYIDNQYKAKSVDFRRALKAYGEMEEGVRRKYFEGDYYISPGCRGNLVKILKFSFSLYLVACTISPPSFFCMELNKALEKNSRSKKVLRIVVTRSEVSTLSSVVTTWYTIHRVCHIYTSPTVHQFLFISHYLQIIE
jgi:hypothetical protein